MNDTTAAAHADNRDTVARSVFAGLSPQRQAVERIELRRSHNPTVPILLVGTLAVTMNLTAQVESAAAKPATKPTVKPNAKPTLLAAPQSKPSATVVAPPATYRVVAGDTIGRIASRYGLSTATVLALNGLRPSSLIFPGQVIRLLAGTTATAAAAPAVPPSPSVGTYTVAAGDTMSGIAARFGVSTAVLLTANGLTAASIIYPGQKVTIPGAQAAPVLDAVPVSSVTPTAPASGTYLIKSGDTISSIARTFGLSTQALLSANGLSAASIIYAGRSLVVPGAAVVVAATGDAVTLLRDDQAANAFTIISVGRQLGVSDYGIVIALSAAMQESGLRNLDHGHLDSVGLFQQRPSVGWGSIAQLTTPSHAARLFYGGPSNPNRGITRGLLDIAGWQSMTVTQAAQRVQVSAYPNAYAKWEASARFWLSQLG